jgi:hypothetical protein
MTTQDQVPAFSLFADGTCFQLLRRAGLTGEGLELVRRHTVFQALLTWSRLCCSPWCRSMF